MDEISRIKQLSDAFGPSGMEDEVTCIVKSICAKWSPVEDHMRNVRVALNECEGPRVMLDCHIDEVGFITQAVRLDGTMEFLRLGNSTEAHLPACRCSILNEEGEKIPAIIASRPPHFLNANEKSEKEDLVLDCGSTGKSETEERFKCGIGSFATFATRCRYEEKTGLFYGKAFDNRIGTAALLQVLQELDGETLPCRVLGSFSTQEEVGERGVLANALALKPDVMIAFEGCPADDTFQPEYKVQAALRKGPMLRNFDRSMITNPRFQKLAVRVAKEHGIPLQQSVRSGGGTDGGMVHLLGVPCIVIGIPVRYIHSADCICAYEDYRSAVELAKELCRTLTKEVVDSL